MMHALVQRLPERIVEKAVKGMLPSGRIGRHLFTHLKVRPNPRSIHHQAASSLPMCCAPHLRAQCPCCLPSSRLTNLLLVLAVLLLSC